MAIDLYTFGLFVFQVANECPEVEKVGEGSLRQLHAAGWAAETNERLTVKGKEQMAKVMVIMARRMRWSVSSAIEVLSPLLRDPGPPRPPPDDPQRLLLARRCMRMRLRMTLKLQASTAKMSSSSTVA